MFTTPSSTYSGLTALLSGQFKDFGTLELVILAIAIPLFFYIIHQLMGFFEEHKIEADEEALMELGIPHNVAHYGAEYVHELGSGVEAEVSERAREEFFEKYGSIIGIHADDLDDD